jgi:pilus assembly protein Flp/PilA
LELDMDVLEDNCTNLVGNKMKKTIMKFARDERGLTTVEYAVAGGLISLAVVTAFTLLGANVERIITQLETFLPG